jgi:hypothetical protein
MKSAEELIQNARRKRVIFVSTAMKKLPFYHIRSADTKCRYPGIFYNKEIKPSLIEEEYQETTAFGFPRNANQHEELEVLNEMIWDDCLTSYLASIQVPIFKKRILELLGFGRRLPSGWMRIYDVPRHFRIVLLALQVENGHHTEYNQTFTSFAPDMGEIQSKAMKPMREFPKSAVLTNQIAMELIDEACEIIFEGYNNDATIVTMSWNANSEKYDYQSHGENQ